MTHIQNARFSFGSGLTSHWVRLTEAHICRRPLNIKFVLEGVGAYSGTATVAEIVEDEIRSGSGIPGFKVTLTTDLQSVAVEAPAGEPVFTRGGKICLALIAAGLLLLFRSYL